MSSMYLGRHFFISMVIVWATAAGQNKTKFANVTNSTVYHKDVDHIARTENDGPTPAEITCDKNMCEKYQCDFKENENERVVGGWETQPNQFPWMAGLTLDGNSRFYCGATLINDRYVLTAGHCVQAEEDNERWKDSLRVTLAEHNQSSTTESKTEVRRVSRVIRHSGFSYQPLDHDIALVKLDRPVEFRVEIWPACLPYGVGNYSDQLASVIGWGYTVEEGNTSDTLRETKVKVLTSSECRMDYGSSRVTDDMICAGDGSNGQDACQGDSGGPLFISNDFGKNMVIGVVSWGDGCAQLNNPGVYTSVDKHLDWIRENTKDACYC